MLIQILSARYGLLEIDQMIPSYNSKMTVKHAESLQAEVSSRLKALVEHSCCQEVFIYASQVYLAALGNYSFYLPPNTSIVTLASTPGYKLAELHRWLHQDQLPQSGIPTSRKSQVVRIKGVTINYTHDQIVDIVQQTFNSEEPSTNYSSWHTIIDGHKIAIKLLISKLTGLPLGSFHTDDAKRAIKHLGFEVFPNQ